MDNVDVKFEGDLIIITVDKTKNSGETSTGKSIKIGNSEGWQPIGDAKDGFKLSMLLIKKKG